jgi:hypothetical protein
MQTLTLLAAILSAHIGADERADRTTTDDLWDCYHDARGIETCTREVPDGRHGTVVLTWTSADAPALAGEPIDPLRPRAKRGGR